MDAAAQAPQGRAGRRPERLLRRVSRNRLLDLMKRGSGGLAARMVFSVDRLQPRLRDVRVDLRGRQAAVAK